MGFSLGKYINKIFGGDISKMSDEELYKKIEAIKSQPRTGRACFLGEVVPSQAVEIPIGMSIADMQETFGVYHLRWSVADSCACDGCKAMDGAIYDHRLALDVEKRKHQGCRCHWVPVDVLRGQQNVDCLLPDADLSASYKNFDNLSRIYEAEKLFPGYTPPNPVQFDPHDPFGHGPARVIAPGEDVSSMDGYLLLDCIAETAEAGAAPDFLISLYEAAEKKRVSPNTKAKICKNLGELFTEGGETEKAIVALKRALEYNPKAPVKRLISKLEKSC